MPIKPCCSHAWDEEVEEGNEAVEQVEQNPDEEVEEGKEAVEQVEQNPVEQKSPLAQTQEELMAKHQLDQSPLRHTYVKPQPPQPPSPKKISLLEKFSQVQREGKKEAGQEARQEAGKEARQEAGTEQAGKRADWFEDYENPKAIKPRRTEKREHFIIVENDRKLRMVQQLCKEAPVIVCCFFKSEVEDISAYLNSRHMTHAKLHRDMHKSRQDGAIWSFNEKRVNVLVITMHLLLKSSISRHFDLINFEIPMSFSDYQSLVSMSKLHKVTTLINDKSGIGLKHLVEAVEVPEFVKKLADKA